MNRYIAFLRGINVGGKNIIRMDELIGIFRSAGCYDVRTLIQSGNVLFASPQTDSSILTGKIGKRIKEKLGYDVKMIMKTFSDISTLVEQNPFKRYSKMEKIKLYITFMNGTPLMPVRLPVVSEKDGLELFRIDKTEAFIVSREINGRYGFPNNFIEKELAVTATTRNWNTIVTLARQADTLSNLV